MASNLKFFSKQRSQGVVLLKQGAEGIRGGGGQVVRLFAEGFEGTEKGLG